MSLDLIDRAMPLRDGPAIEFEVHTFAGADFERQAFDLARDPGEAVYSNPAHLFEKLDHRFTGLSFQTGTLCNSFLYSTCMTKGELPSAPTN